MKLALVALLALALGGARVADEQRTGEISVISSSGGTTHPLTSGPALQPSLSPDGRTLAFVSDQIRVMSRDGSGQRPVGTANGERPQWSPNGGSLVYTAWDVSGCVPPAPKCAVTDVWTVNADGTGARRVLGLALHPSWSPNGRRLLFRDFVGPAEQVMPAGALKLAWADGSHVRILSRRIDAQSGEFNPAAWSPDGKWVAFSATTGTGAAAKDHLFLIRPDGSQLHLLTTAGMFPAWSPNGQLVAFERESFRPYRISLWVIRRGGGRAHRVSADGECPAWSPDGARIAFLTYANPHLGVVRLDGRGRKLLSVATNCDDEYAHFPSPPVWSRDGHWIYFVG